MLSFIGRLILVPTGLILAFIVSIFVLVTLGAERAAHELHDAQPVTIAGNIEILLNFVALISAITIVPALLVIIVGEIARLRSIIYYIAGGGVALVCIPLLAQFNHTYGLSVLGNTVWPVFATAGFFGGFTYWLIAGRSA